MAEVIHFKDGSSEAVLTDKPAFIEECIREKLGKETADFISDYIKELLDEIEHYEIALLEPERAADGSGRRHGCSWRQKREEICPAEFFRM